MKTIRIAYWITTGLLIVQFGGSAIANLTHHPVAMTTIQKLGYPAYIADFLGVAKLTGLIVLLAPALRSFKDWAYAGLAINAVLAFYSFAALDLIVPEMAAALVALVFVFAAYFLNRARERKALTVKLV